MAWYDDEEGSFDFGNAFDIPIDSGFDFGGLDLGGIPSDAFDIDFGSLFSGPDLGSIPSDAFDVDFSSLFTGPDLGSIPSDAFDVDFSSLFTGPDLSNIPSDAFDVDFSQINTGPDLSNYDVEAQPGGFYGETDRATYDPFANMTTITDQDLGTRYVSDGYDVLYRPDDVVEVQRPDGSLGYYHSQGGNNYYVQYEDPNKPGDLVSTYEQSEQGGPTRGVFYSGEGKDATVADYSNVFGSPTDTVKTTMTKSGLLGDKTTTNTMEGGKTTTDKVDTTTEITKIINRFLGTDASNKDIAMWAALLGGLMGLMGGKGTTATGGYTGGIPKYTATRGTPTSPTAGGRRAGGAGLGSLTGGVTYTKAAQGGLMDVLAGQPNESVLMMAKGGETGRYLRGQTDGMADKIYTDIDGQQPARLSHGEFVIPADVVSHLGNGNSDAGAKQLHEMMNRVRKARTGTTKQGKEINPRKHMAA